MSTTRLRDKSQMTVPADVARQLGLKTDTLLDVRVVGDAFVVRAGGGAAHPMRFWGQGRPGRTVEEIDAELSRQRDEWER